MKNSDRPEPKCKVGNIVSVHFDEPSAIGYNGTCHRVESIEWRDSWNGWDYCLRSLNGHGFIHARENEITFQSERYHEPYYGPCFIEIGD